MSRKSSRKVEKSAMAASKGQMTVESRARRPTNDCFAVIIDGD